MFDDTRAVIRGALAGAAATAAMSAAMLTARALGLTGELPPKKITEAAMNAAGVEHADEATRDAASAVMHLAFGMGAGALFGLLSRRAHTRLSPRAQGVAYGALVWTVSYLGWVPALGIMPPAQRDRPGRAVTMLLSHGVYGAILGRLAGSAG